MDAVEVDEAALLLLVHDYLEERGFVESLRALETEAAVKPGPFATVRRLALNGRWRELESALPRQHEKEEAEGNGGLINQRYLQRVMFVIAKQRYLESLTAIDLAAPYRQPSEEELKQLLAQLQRLERLAPSKEDYSALEELSAVGSSLNLSGSWDLHSSRARCYHSLAQWMSELYSRRPDDEGVLGRGAKGKIAPPIPDPRSQLSVLVTKGKMYEECERVCMERCGSSGGGERGDHEHCIMGSGVFDFCSWLQSQPEGMFQVAPSLVNLMTSPHNHQHTPENRSRPAEATRISLSELMKGGTPANEVASNHDTQKLHDLSHPGSQPATAPTNTSSLVADQVGKAGEGKGSGVREGWLESGASDPETTNGNRRKARVREKMPKERKERQAQKRGEEPQGVHNVSRSRETVNLEESTEHKEQVRETTEQLRASMRTNSTPPAHNLATETQVIHSSSSPPPLQAYEGRGMLSKMNQQSFHPNPTPLPSSLRASTKYHSLPPDHASPIVSPSAWLLATTPLPPSLQPGGVRGSSTPKPSSHLPLPPSSPPSSPVPHMQEVRKLIDFHQEQHKVYPQHQSVIWPTATLAGRVSDPQVVRSVAFSQSGCVVAVGANSRTLRLCSTSALLDGTCSGREVPVLYHHPRYHRSSIYCLAWWNDSLLASGSNDKTIQLLSYSPSTDTHPCNPRGQMTFHTGTIRELLFLPDGKLVSAAAGLPNLALSECETLRLVGKLPGHAGQVLSLGLLASPSVIISGGEDGTARVWDPALLRSIHTIRAEETVTSVSAYGYQLALALADGCCALYDARSWKRLESFQPHSDECRSIRHSPDGRWLLSGSYDGSVCLAEAGGVEWVELVQHADKVIQSRWHPTGTLFASSGADKTARFWTLQ